MIQLLNVGSDDHCGCRVEEMLVNGRDLGAILVREGLAISETNYGDPYRREENQARERGRGMWE